MGLHLKIKSYGMGSLPTLLITLLLFTKFFSKKTQPLHFVMCNDMSGAKVEKVTQPFYKGLMLISSNAIPLQMVHILGIHGFSN